MIKNKRVLALVTARGGSKRLPRKNILDLYGKPLIAWSIEAGLLSKYIDDVIVSTEDQEIKDISLKYGANLPFNRPLELAKDDTLSHEVIVHALNALSDLGSQYDYIFLLQPTSPLRTSRHIDEAIELLVKKNADSIIGVTEVDYPVEWANILTSDQSMTHFFKSKKSNVDGAKKPKKFRVNGAVYICSIEKLLQSQSMILESNCYAYIMDRSVSVDIDYEVDFILAEALLKNSDNKK